MPKQNLQVTWNSETDRWETSEHSDVYSETWPILGTMRSGVAYLPPKQVRHTAASEYSSSQPSSNRLFRTITADEAGGGPLAPLRARALKKTIRVTSEVIDLISPQELKENPNTEPRWGSVDDEYLPAREHWSSVLGHPVPHPTDLNRNGRHVLSAEFGEWMMGLEPGWITDVPGLTHKQRLRAAGNGVVPQQAVLALREMLEEE